MESKRTSDLVEVFSWGAVAWAVGKSEISQSQMVVEVEYARY